MRVRITAEHLAHGEPNDPNHCPVALALEELTGHPCSVGSTSASILDDHGEEALNFFLPHPVPDYIFDFDEGRMPAPFEFEVDLREAWLPDWI